MLLNALEMGDGTGNRRRSSTPGRRFGFAVLQFTVLAIMPRHAVATAAESMPPVWPS